MSDVAGAAMRDPWRRLLARILPWFDQEEFDAERKATKDTLAQSRALRGPDRIRLAYQQYADGLKR